VKHAIHRSIEAMIHPETLSVALGQSVNSARLAPFTIAGWSATGSDFLGVHVNQEQQPSLVVKRMSMEWDWLMHTTGDIHARSVMAWAHGLLDQMPSEIDTTVIACAYDGAGQAILMYNVTEALLSGDDRLSESQNEIVLNAMASLHATFWEDAVLRNPALGLCSLADFITHTAPDKCERLLGILPDTEVVNIMLGGWRLLPAFVDRDVANLLTSLARDPSILVAALDAYPRTLVHGDLRVANIGVPADQPQRAIFLDLARLSPAPPAIDLAYYLVTSNSSLPVSPEKTMEIYEERLAQRLGSRFDESWWQPQLELCLLASFLPISCFKAWFAAQLQDASERAEAQASFDWWSEHVRRAAKRLPH